MTGTRPTGAFAPGWGATLGATRMNDHPAAAGFIGHPTETPPRSRTGLNKCGYPHGNLRI